MDMYTFTHTHILKVFNLLISIEAILQQNMEWNSPQIYLTMEKLSISS